jgi:hypothetical protein
MVVDLGSRRGCCTLCNMKNIGDRKWGTIHKEGVSSSAGNYYYDRVLMCWPCR